MYIKVNNIGKENIIVDYSKIDNVDVLIKLRNFCKKYKFEEDLKEIENDLNNKLIENKNYIKYCCSLKLYPLDTNFKGRETRPQQNDNRGKYCCILKPYPLEPKYYSHVTDSINKIKLII